MPSYSLQSNADAIPRMCTTFDDETTLDLWSAVHHDEPRKLREIIKDGADVNKADRNGQTPLHAAVSSAHDEIVKILIKSGANVDQENENGQTALHLASSLGYAYIVMRLLRADCDVNKKTKFSEMTALHMASRGGHTEVVKLLMDSGADHLISDAIGKRAEFYAASKEIAHIFTETVDRPYYRHLSMLKHRDSIDSHTGNSNSGITPTPISSDPRQKKPPKKKKVVIVDHKMEYSDKFKQRMEMSVFDRLASSKK